MNNKYLIYLLLSQTEKSQLPFEEYIRLKKRKNLVPENYCFMINFVMHKNYTCQ